MADSYFVTYGSDRLSYPGATGSVAWEYTPATKFSGYYEKLLWLGSLASKNSSAGLNTHPSAFDDIRIVCGGGNSINNSMLYETVQVPYKALSAINKQYIELPMFGSTSTAGVTNGWWFGGLLTGCSGTAWTLASAWGRSFNSNAVNYRYDFFQVKSIWGIHYG